MFEKSCNSIQNASSRMIAFENTSVTYTKDLVKIQKILPQNFQITSFKQSVKAHVICPHYIKSLTHILKGKQRSRHC